MGAYGAAIPAADRWAIISYVRALQDAAKKAASASAKADDKDAASAGTAVDAPAKAQ